MFDKDAIAERFFSCFPEKSITDIAKFFGVAWPTVRQWKLGIRPVPLLRVKQVADTQGITLDWLLIGKEPKHRLHYEDSDTLANFDKAGINRRFLSFFEGKNKSEIARELGVTHSAVCSWFSGRRQVPWEKLEGIVIRKQLTWDWMLEGNGQQ
jgi:hypothetical protein